MLSFIVGSITFFTPYQGFIFMLRAAFKKGIQSQKFHFTLVTC